jgi:hypothetical protein
MFRRVSIVGHRSVDNAIPKLKVLSFLALSCMLCGLVFGVPHPTTEAKSVERHGLKSRAAGTNEPTSRKSSPTGYGALPLSFEPNEGQTDPSVQFISHGAGYTVFLTANEAVLSLEEPDETDRLVGKMDAHTRKRFEARRFYQASPRFHRQKKAQTIRVAIEGVNPSSTIVPLDQLPGKANYFIGRDPQKWRAGILTYAKVKYSTIYPGIDLIYYGKQGRLEFDFVVAPDADPNAIRLHFDAVGQLSITEDGKLKIDMPGGSFELLRPEIYQVHDGKRIPVLGRFAFSGGDKTVGIQVAKYDHKAQLIIDPALSYSTYVGGNGADYDSGVGVDARGDAYIAGMTNSTTFPTYNGYPSSGNSKNVAFVTELNPTGTAVLYSTYLGGTGGDWCAGMTLDSSGRVYITGGTLSTDFPLVNAFQTSRGSPNGNAFVAVIDTTQAGTASLAYSTYLGGGGNGSNSLGDVGLAIAADASGFAYITGQTASDSSTAAFPTTLGTALQSSLASTNGNAFLTVLDTNHGGLNSLMYSTYLGGASAGFGDYGLGIAADSLGNAYLTGQTTSSGSMPFPTSSSAYQTALNSQYGNVFVTKIATAQGSSPALVYSTYLGGSSTIIVGDLGSGINIDPSGKIYVGGDTTSADFPVTSGAFQATNSAAGKAFVAAFDPTQVGSQSLIYSTLLGGTNGSQGEVANALAIDSKGDAFVAGSTSSSDFPTTSDAFQTTLKNSSWDAFLTELNPTGTSALYSTYFGGSCADGDLGNGVAIDLAQNAYLGGTTCSPDLPATAGAYQTALAGARNAFVAEIPLPTSVVSIQLNPSNPTLVSGSTQQFSAVATLNNGNTEDVTASASWSASNTSVLLVLSVPPSQGYAVGTSVGATYVTATLGTLMASTGVAVVSRPPTPTITSVSPTSGSAGTQVTVAGSGFGAAQGQGYLWLGSTLGTIGSWSDTQIVATVAPTSTSGTVQVTQAGLQSNSVSFTVATATITTVTPTSGVAGTQVTITGSGFGAAQGNGQVWLGTANGIVNSWSDTQVVATVASGSTSGNAQILQGGVWSNAVQFAVNIPVITSITPTSGGAGTSVTVAGSGFGASQGSGTVWIGGTYASATSWSDTQVVATVGTNAVTGIAKIQQNGTWSNAVTFTVPSGSPITLVPNIISMVVGDTRSIQALNSSFQVVTGLTWTSSDTTILTLSTDDPPVLTAVAPGNVTIFAGGASADVTVYPGSALPIGTVSWSNPGDGSGVQGIIPAVPSDSGVDVFGFQNDSNLQAIKTDGTVAWTDALSTANLLGPPVPDFQGGAIAYTGQSVYKLDGTTGHAYPAYSGTSLSYPVVHTDGTIFTSDNDGTNTWVVGVNPLTGQAKFKVLTANSTVSYLTSSPNGLCGTSSSGESSSPSYLNPMIIAGDGYAYTSYFTSDGVSNEREEAQLAPPKAYPIFAELYVNLTTTSPRPASYYLALAQADIAALEAMTGGIYPGLFGVIQQDVNNAMNDLANNQPDDTDIADAESQYGMILGTGFFTPLCSGSDSATTKLHLLRVGSDGSSNDIIVHQWKWSTSSTYSITGPTTWTFSQTQAGSSPTHRAANVITNADQGAVLSWNVFQNGYCASFDAQGCSENVGSVLEQHLTTSAGGSIVSDVIWNVPGAYPRELPVQPLLQMADGSFIGSVYGNSVLMLRFNTSGTIQWSVPGYYPAIATADGGLIGTSGQIYGENGLVASSYGTAATFGANGNATGQVQGPTLPTYSWLGDAYQYGSVDQIFVQAISYASTFAALPAGNDSANGTATLEQWYPPLPSCTAVFMVCAGDALQAALGSLRQLLSGPCSACQSLVFSHPELLGTQGQYAQYLSNRTFFFDGSHSTLIMNNFQPGFGIQTVSQYMGTEATAITQTPGRSQRMITFFATTGPAAVCNSLNSKFNEGTIFHELLHAKSGRMDRSLIQQPDLLSLFGLNDMGSSDQLTFYLIDNVLGGGSHTCGN